MLRFPALMAPHNPETLARWDREHLWHPFTQMLDWGKAPPIVIERGEGSFLIDTHGRRWLDGVASMWTNVHGHRKAELDSALKEQVDRIAHSTLLGLSGEQPILLARKLVELVPGFHSEQSEPGAAGKRPRKEGKALTRVFYSDNGSTAVEVAIKMAFQYWQHRGHPERSRFVRLKDSYHGDTLGAVSVGGIDLYHSTFRSLLFESIAAPNPYELRPTCGAVRGQCTAGCIRALEQIFDREGKSIAALLLEPRVQGAAGYLVHGPEYVAAAERICREHGALLILDEVATGFGRTGPMWACESAGVVPDILCTAKGLTAGYLPLSATVTTEEVFDAFLGTYAEQKTFFHGHTFTGNPLACAVALASIELFRTENILERSKSRIAHLARRLAGVAGHPHVAEVRQAGFMVGIELAPSRNSDAQYPWEERMGMRACLAARDKGVFLRPLGNVVVLNPPLSISEEEIDQLVGAALHGIEAATSGAVA